MSAIISLFSWPFRLVKGPVYLVARVLGVRKHRSYRLPVAGLQEAKAQSIVFTLKRAATSDEEERIARDWLTAWQLAQVASNRLLHELDEVQANLQFWGARARHSSHFWFTLLQQGPVGFYRRVRQLLPGQEQAVPLLSEAELVEKRLLIFRLLRTALCEALAKVQAAGALLYLQQGTAHGTANGTTAPAGGALRALHAGGSGRASPTGGAGSDSEIVVVGEQQQEQGGGQEEGGEEEEEEGLFDRARQAVEAAAQEIEEAFRQLQASAHAALDIPEAVPLAQAEEAHGREVQMLTQTVQKVLGLHHLRRLLSRGQLQQGRAAAGAQPAAPAPPGPAFEEVAGEEEGEEEEGRQAGEAGLAAALRRAQRAVGLAAAEQPPGGGGAAAAAAAAALAPLAPGASTSAAAGAARAAAQRLRRRRVIALPAWLLMPSDLQQHWIRYSLMGIGAGYAALFVYKHSRLSGSRDLENWAKTGAASVQGAVRDHVARPLRQVKDELFNTFRRRPTIVSMSEFEADRDSLQRMLDDFKADLIRRRGAAALPGGPPTQPAPSPTSGTSSSSSPSSSSLPREATGAEVAPLEPAPGSGPVAGAGAGGELVPLEPSPGLEGMALVMRCYEQELKKPLRNLVNGELMRSLLIQVQKLKVDTESAMLEMDQILKANELSISLVAAVPAFLVAGTALYSLGRWLTPTPPDPRWEAVPCRLAMVEVARALEALCTSGDRGEPESPEDQGWLFYCLAVEYEEAALLFRRHRQLLLGGSARSEWPALRDDLVGLAAPAPAKARLRTAKRMMRAYSVFHQF